MKLSVVVPTRDRKELLRGCLLALQSQTRPADEIVVVDNGSRDGTAAAVAAEFPGARLVFENKRGVHHARNRGLRAAQGEVVAFTDDDCLPEPGWLESLAACFEDPAISCAGGPTEALWTSPPSPALLRSRRALFCLGIVGFGGERRRLDPSMEFLIGANMAVRKSEAGDGFRPVQAYGPLGVCGDDFELSRRLPAVYEPRALVRHRIDARKVSWPRLLSRVFVFSASGGRAGQRLKPKRGPREWLGFEGLVGAADALGNLYGRFS